MSRALNTRASSSASGPAISASCAWEERSAEIIEKASRANQSLDRLDELTHRREQLLQREGGRVLNIQGREFALRGEGPEAVPLYKAQPERELSMTELLRREKGIAPAEPSPAPTREQTHNR